MCSSFGQDCGTHDRNGFRWYFRLVNLKQRFGQRRTHLPLLRRRCDGFSGNLHFMWYVGRSRDQWRQRRCERWNAREHKRLAISWPRRNRRWGWRRRRLSERLQKFANAFLIRLHRRARNRPRCYRPRFWRRLCLFIGASLACRSPQQLEQARNYEQQKKKQIFEMNCKHRLDRHQVVKWVNR